MIYQFIKELDNDENSVVELVEDADGKRFVRRIMKGKIDIYLALQKLSHPFLPKIEIAEFDGENTVIIEEYIENIGDLKCLESEHEIVKAFCELCEVLDFIHKHDIIHRDIKPSNVLVANDGHIRLIDFDAARQYKNEAPNDTRYLGTKGYAPPEQFGFTQTDYTADIYALGVTMKNVMESLSNSRKYKKIIRKCTEFDPDNRYRSAAAVKISLVLAKKRYYLEAVMAVLVCVGIVIAGSMLINRQNNSTDILSASVTISESFSETTALNTEATTTVPETTVTSVTTPETVSETITTEETYETKSASTTSLTTTVPSTETEIVYEISASIAEAEEASDKSFELISPSNEKLIPQIAKKEVEDGLYTDYFVDEYSFVTDKEILGRWIAVAIIDTFDPKLIKEYYLNGNDEHVRSPQIGHIQEIEFVDNGKCFSYYNTYASISEWTYGAIVNDYFIDAKSISNYYIFRIKGIDYLFVEGKLNDGDLKDDGTADNCVVFQRFIKNEDKTDNVSTETSAKGDEVVREIISPTDEGKIAEFEKRLADDGKYYDFYADEYNFVSDPNVIGAWTAVDYTSDCENWIYNKYKPTDELWITKAEFNSDGSFICYNKKDNGGASWKWTYGQTINNSEKYNLIGNYYLYHIDNEEFLFVEWKNGDYMKNSEFKSGWYVFKKV
ncbi:MAG: serine/threonine protein kinase [Oscillospiraceae bacterium]|nr:serine/threonine protein kinase [Oscillospiraceae bacterium]